MFIDGEFVSAVSGATFDAISPIDQRVLAKVAAGDSHDVDKAVAAAKRTFENGVWRDLNPRDKKNDHAQMGGFNQRALRRDRAT